MNNNFSRFDQQDEELKNMTVKPEKKKSRAKIFLSVLALIIGVIQIFSGISKLSSAVAGNRNRSQRIVAEELVQQGEMKKALITFYKTMD